MQSLSDRGRLENYTHLYTHVLELKCQSLMMIDTIPSHHCVYMAQISYLLLNILSNDRSVSLAMPCVDVYISEPDHSCPQNQHTCN